MIRAVIFDMYETLITHYRTPLYFSAEMAADAGIPPDRFRALWRATEAARSTGKMTLEAALEMILRETGCYSDTLLAALAAKRVAVKEDCFRHLHPEIVPMLSRLKEKGILIGLISNCFSEEAAVIRQSSLFPWFDAVCLSWEQGIQKPDPKIFRRCVDALGLGAAECLYVGDGGSYELEAAEALGMKAVQAVWYFGVGQPHPSEIKQGFPQVGSPLGIIERLEESSYE